MKKIDTLNLVPFIDIMLVLLVIVLVSASFVQQSKIQVDIPSLENNQSGYSENAKEQKTISIDKNGLYYFEEQQLDFAQLKAQLAQLEKDTNIIIQGDKKSDLQNFLELNMVLQNLNFQNIFVIADEKKYE